jgi:transcription initiation factor IIE alpha subunit
MAIVINIVSKDFSPDFEETITLGECSNCGNMLTYQFQHGFPKTCPYCNEDLENGTDEREIIKSLPKMKPGR